MMKINAMKFGMACGISMSLLWIACSFLVMVMPAIILSITGDMLHMQLNDMGWHLTFLGFFKGLLGWFFTAVVSGWLLAVVYNRLLQK
jgi:hypothetical protein